MAHPENGTVAVLVATADRPALLERRALPSIASRSRLSSRVVVVDDSGVAEAAARSEQTVRDWRPAGIAVDFLRNRRTKGASGAWNSGLDHLLRTCGDPRRVHVAILDDDDHWEAGFGPAAIAKDFRVSRSTVQRVITAAQRDGGKTER